MAHLLPGGDGGGWRVGQRAGRRGGAHAGARQVPIPSDIVDFLRQDGQVFSQVLTEPAGETQTHDHHRDVSDITLPWHTCQHVTVLLLCNLSAVRGPVLVRVNVVLILILLHFQGDRLGPGGGRPVAVWRLVRGGRMGGAFGSGDTATRLVFFIRGRREVRALLSATGT